MVYDLSSVTVAESSSLFVSAVDSVFSSIVAWTSLRDSSLEQLSFLHHELVDSYLLFFFILPLTGFLNKKKSLTSLLNK